MVLVEQQYKDIRRKLDEMGYHQPCSVESILLVDKLLNDLSFSREKQLLYEEMAHDSLKKCEVMEHSTEIYKKDNNHLLKENNKMHLQAIKFKEESDRKIKELKIRISDLENMYSDLEFNYMEQMTNMGTLRQELLDKTNKLYEMGFVEKDVEKTKGMGSNLSKIDYCKDNLDTNYKLSTKDELEDCKRKQRQLLYEIEILESQVQSRDKEIARLGYQLENQNRAASENDPKKCSCHLMNACAPKNLISTAEMYEKVKAAQDKQHEAMQRAIILADRLEELETELKDLKKRNMTNTQCSCGTNISLLKKQHVDTLNRVEEMEARITKLQCLINSLTKEKDDSKEKITALETERVSLDNKLKNFKSIENDFMSEIDRLQQNNADLKNEIAHLAEKNNNLLQAIENATINTNVNKPLRDIKNVSPSNDSGDKLCEKIKAERDYYCNELHRLQEKVYNAERIHDIQCCRHLENEVTHMKQMRCDLQLAKEENRHLQEEITSLRNQLKEFSSCKYDTNKLIENHIKRLEYDKGVLASSNSSLKSKLRTADCNLEELNKQVGKQVEELNNCKIKNNHLKKLNMQLELSLNNSEAALKRAEFELTQCISRINELEKELKRTKEAIMAVKKEKQEIRENLLRTDSEKDELLLKIDEKTILLSNLDKDLQRKHTQIAQIENKNSEIQTELQTVERMLQEAQDKCRDYVKSNRNLEQEIISLQSCKENLLIENQTLKRELAAVSQDIILTNKALEKSRQESENLKRELQTYVDEVRRVETILQEKEREREALLEQFNALSAEATQLETSHQTLECEANLSKDNLRDTQEKLYALQQDATAKESMVSLLDQQVGELSDQVVQLQSKISEMGNHELFLTTDLDAARNLCSRLEEQKQYYSSQISQMASAEKVLREELDRLECENETLHSQLSREQKSSYTLENMLTSSRHDAMEKCLYNEDLMKEVNQMKETIVSLETKLNSVKSALSDCQNACADYHTQNVQLRRQITNEKFEKAKDIDSNSTSL